MKNRYFKLFLMLVLAGCFVGCSDDDDDVIPEWLPVGTEPVFKGGIEVDVENTVFKREFEEGDMIGIFAVERDDHNRVAYPKAEGNYVNNARWVMRNGKWVPAREWDSIHFAGKPLDIYAYYPYDVENVDPTRMEVVVPQEHRLDLLTARGVFSEDDSVELTFRHKFALLRARVLPNGIGAMPSDLMTARVYFVGKEGYLNLSVADPRNEMVFDYPEKCYTEVPQAEIPEGATYREFDVFVPVQTLVKGNRLFQFTQCGGVVNHVLEENLVMKGVMDMEILLQADIDTEHVYQVGDVYPSTGFPAGIVIKVTDGGKHGTIAALSGFSRTWGTKEITGATNEEDGRENHKAVEAYDPEWESHFPAFAACRELGEGWYLGAKQEYITLFNFYKENKTDVNALFRSWGMGSPSFGGLSSTENTANPKNYVWNISLPGSSVSISQVTKSATAKISPLCRF